MTYLVEIDAAIDAAGTVETLRYSDEGHITRPDETPANAYYAPRLTQPGNLARTMFSGGTAGQSRVGFGEIVLSNMDGGLDGIRDYGFDGRRCVVRTGPAGAAYPDGFTVAFTGNVEQATFDWSRLSFVLRDRLAELDAPLLSGRYLGTNALPDGLEGQAQDLKGKTRPRAYGRAFNVAPPLVNTARLIYEVGQCHSVDAAYDRAAALTKGTDYTSRADMEANAPAAGNFRVWPEGGYIRLGSSPAGQITADVTQGATASVRSTAQLLRQVALAAGILVADISVADVVALDVLNNAETGVWVTDTMTALAAMDALAASIGAWYGFDRQGSLRMGRLDIPAGTPVAELDRTNVVGIDRVVSRDTGRGLPVWRMTVNYAKNWTVQPSDLAGAVTSDRRTWLALERRAAAVEDAAVKNQYLLAGEMARDTLLVEESAAANEADRLMAIYQVKREVYQAQVRVDEPLIAVLDLGAVVRLTLPRFGLDAGKLFCVIGITADYRSNALELTLWG